MLGNGFLEPVYQEPLAIEFAERNIPFEREQTFSIGYKGRKLGCTYRADFVCFQAVIVEVKAIGHLSNTEHSQVINYLKAAGVDRGLLLNFGTTSLQHRRLIRSNN